MHAFNATRHWAFPFLLFATHGLAQTASQPNDGAKPRNEFIVGADISWVQAAKTVVDPNVKTSTGEK
jgi:hypothetical protein